MGARAIAVLAVGSLLLACGGDSGGTGDATATPSPIATTTAGPSPTAAAMGTAEPGIERPGAEGFRAFAAQVQDALDRRNADFFLDRVQFEGGICTSDDLTPGIGQRPCTSEGATWEGFPTGAWRSEGGWVDPDQVPTPIDLWDEARPELRDAFGDGAVRVHAIATDSNTGHTIVTALRERPAEFAGTGPLRVARVVSWSFDGERWRMTRSLAANVLGEEFLYPCDAALDYLRVFGGPEWERYPDPGAAGPGAEDCPLA